MNKPEEIEFERSYVIRHEQCPKCAEEGRDTSEDNLAVYADGGQFCYSTHGIIKYSDTFKAIKNAAASTEPLDVGGALTELTWSRIEANSSISPRGHRSLTKATCDKYGVRHTFDSEGKVIMQYYPITKNNDMVGIRWRDDEKRFYKIGEVGMTCDLFGMSSFYSAKSNSVVIAAGEIDTLSMYQILSDYYKNRGYEVPVVCTTTGEGSFKQIQKHYNWFNDFDKIIVVPDQDEAGEAALHKLAKVLPHNKLYVMRLPKGINDVNDALVAGHGAKLLDLYFKASRYSPSGILGSDTLFHNLYTFENENVLTLPDFLHKMQTDYLAGGIIFPSLVNIVAPSGIGKSTILNEIIYHWIFKEPYTLGVLALESTDREFSKLLSSRHLNRKLTGMDQASSEEFLNSHKDFNRELFFTEDGDPRFYFMEELDGNVARIQELILTMILQCNCKVIVIDPLQDLFAGLSNEDQEVFLGWLKMIIKRYDLIIVCVNHIRKQDSKTDQTKMYTESEIMGSSTIIKSSFLTLLLNRNKYLDKDDYRSNVTSIVISKNRGTGLTGPCPSLYYDRNTHRLYDLDDYKKEFPDLFGENEDYEGKTKAKESVI